MVPPRFTRPTADSRFIVSHDADFLDSVCTDIIQLHEKKLYQHKGGYTQFCKMRDQQWQKRVNDYDKQQDKLKALTRGQMTKQQAMEKARDGAIPSLRHCVKRGAQFEWPVLRSQRRRS